MQNKNFGWDLKKKKKFLLVVSWYHNEKSDQNAWTKPTKPFPPAEGFKKILLQRADKSANMDTKGNLRKKKQHLTKIYREMQLQKASLKYMEVCKFATRCQTPGCGLLKRHWTPKRNDGWNILTNCIIEPPTIMGIWHCCGFNNEPSW